MEFVSIFQIWLKSDKITDTLHEELYAFMQASQIVRGCYFDS